MDNFHFDITSVGKTHLQTALSLAFGSHRKAIGYSIEKNTLIFYWAEHSAMTKFPFQMNADQATEWVLGWLDQSAKYGTEPDHDGDNKCGFRAFNEAWGHVCNRWEAFVGVQPAWAMYGK